MREMKARDRIGIDFITALGLPPVDFVELAAELHCSQITIGLQPIARLEQYPTWSLRDDLALRKSTIAALQRTQLRVAVGEGFLIAPGKDIRDAQADLDVMRELGAEQVNVVSIEPDRARGFDQCAAFADLAAMRGMTASVEFLPVSAIPDLATALVLVRQIGASKLKLLIDAMHLFRSGALPSAVAGLAPSEIGHVQLCDVPLVAKLASYGEEARFERLPPGAGELPLVDLLLALPPNVPLGLEVPMRTRAESGVGPRERFSMIIDAAHRLVEHADAIRRSPDEA